MASAPPAKRAKTADADSPSIADLVLQGRIPEAIVAARLSGISPLSDTLEGRLQQGDFGLARTLARQRATPPYFTDVDGLKAELERHGVAIIPGVLNAEECAAMRDGLWAHFSRVLPALKRDDPRTWREVFKLYPKHGMLHQHYQAGVRQAAFDVRQNPKVVEPFARIFGDRALTSSLDGVAFGLDPGETDRGWEGKDWLHLDQSTMRDGSRSSFECVQSWVTADDVAEGDATLRVLVGSHRLHKEFSERFGSDDRHDWHMLTPEQEAWYRERGCAVHDVVCPAGSQVFWDSRTVHSGRSPVRGRESDRNRYVVYASYLPQARISARNAAKKRDAVMKGRMTSHWPDARKLFPKKPRTYGGPLHPEPRYVRPTLTKLGAALFGWHDAPASCPLVARRPETVET